MDFNPFPNFKYDKKSMEEKVSKNQAVFHGFFNTKYGEPVSIYIESGDPDSLGNMFILISEKDENEYFYSEVTKRNMYCKITSIQVPDFHHQGYGTLLVQIICDFYKENGMNLVLADMDTSKGEEHFKHLIVFYQSLGFQTIGTIARKTI